MSAVRFNMESCDALLDATSVASSTIGEVAQQLGPLLSSAMQLLDQPITPVSAAQFDLYEVSRGLDGERRDLDWRVQYVRRFDGDISGTVALGMPNWRTEHAEAVLLEHDINTLVSQLGEGLFFEQDQRRAELEALVDSYLGTADPDFTAAVLEGLYAGEPITLAIENAPVRMQIAGQQANIAQLMELYSLSADEAAAVADDMHRQINLLTAQGHSVEDVINVVHAAYQYGLDVDAIAQAADNEGLSLIDATTRAMQAHIFAMTGDELDAYNGFKEHFDVFDRAYNGENDGRVSVTDLSIVANDTGDSYSAEQIAAATAILGHRDVLTRLDSARDNGDVINNGDPYGDNEFDDHLISLTDIAFFEEKQQINHFVAQHFDDIDIAAQGGAHDGFVSRDDFQAFLDDNRENLTAEEIAAFETVIDAKLYDKDFWERNRGSIALLAAVAAGAFITVGSGGAGGAFAAGLILMVKGAAAGAVVSGSVTVGMNMAMDGYDWNENLTEHVIEGGLAGAAGAGLRAVPIAWNAAPSPLGQAAVVLGTVSDATAIVGMGATDVLIDGVVDHEDFDFEGLHDGANTVSFVTGVAGITTGGVDAGRAWQNNRSITEAIEELPGPVERGLTHSHQGVGEDLAMEWLQNTPAGELYLMQVELANSSMDHDALLDIAVDQVATGRQLPNLYGSADTVQTLVPVGGALDMETAVWATPSTVAEANGRDLFDSFGLHARYYASQYEVWAMTAEDSAGSTFRSTVAPTLELDGLIRNSGGIEQVLISNPNSYTAPAQTGHVLNNVGERVVPTREIATALNTVFDEPVYDLTDTFSQDAALTGVGIE